MFSNKFMGYVIVNVKVTVTTIAKCMHVQAHNPSTDTLEPFIGIN